MSDTANQALVEAIMDLIDPVLAAHLDATAAPGTGPGPDTAGTLTAGHLGSVVTVVDRSGHHRRGALLLVEHAVEDGEPCTRLALETDPDTPSLFLVVSCAAPVRIGR